MKKNITAIAAFILLLTSSCTVTMPVAASDASIGENVGVSKTTVFLGIEFNGKYGIKEAADNGGIEGEVSLVDEKYTSYVLIGKKTLIVKGN